MRRSSLLLLTLPCAWVACFSSGSSGSSGGATFDASEDTTFPDSSPDVFSPGEDGGPDVGPTADATPPPQDASLDVPLGDAAETGPVAVAITVFGAGGPEPGVTVVYQDATGAVVGTPATTGATGTVSQPLPAGAAMITVLLGTGVNPAPYTVMGVQPGDVIVVPDFASLAPYSSGIAEATALPPSPPANTASYQISSGSCVGYGTAAPLTANLFGAGCIGLGFFGGAYGAALPLLVQAQDANNDVLGFAFQNNVPLSGFDAGAEVLGVSLASNSWLTTTTTQTVAVTNQPDGGSPVTTTVSESADRILRPLYPQFVTDDAGEQQTLVTTHLGYADTVQVEAMLQSSPLWTIATATESAPPTTSGTITIDATPLGTLPQITGLTVDGTTTPAQPKLTWTLSQGTLASSTTGLVANFFWNGMTDAGSFANGSWTVVAPSSATSIQLPALPASAGAYAPIAGATYQTVFQGLVGTAVPTYAQLRTVGTTVAAPVSQGCFQSPVLPYVPSGTLSVTIYESGECG